MTAVAQGSTALAAPTEHAPASKSRFNAGNIGTLAVIALIIFWCLAPFYWMLVLAFRETAFTFETTPWFTHLTLENFRY
ncbi:MAG: carbohydrate ABC transporter permease, partial [Jatrophihabitantaceae bacterium]